MLTFKVSIILLLLHVGTIHAFSSSSADFLCKKQGRLGNHAQEIVVVYESVDEPMMKESIEDTVCWAKKNFVVTTILKSPTNNLCFDLHQIEVKPQGRVLVIANADPKQDCAIQIFGPLPNFININSRVADSGNNTYSRVIELGFKNAGGYMRTTIDLQQPDASSTFNNTLLFYIHNLDLLTPFYGSLVPWWKPKRYVPPLSFATKERVNKLMEQHDVGENNSIIITISCLPMLLLAVSLSVYLVIHPRSALKYSDEEVDFIIETIDETMPPLPPTEANVSNPPNVQHPLSNRTKNTRNATNQTSGMINYPHKEKLGEKMVANTKTRGSSDDDIHTNSTLKSEAEHAPLMLPPMPMKSKASRRLRLSVKPTIFSTRKMQRTGSNLRLPPTKDRSPCEIAIDRTLSSH